MKLIIKDDEDRKTVVPIVRDEYAIGRQEGNHIRLTERNVSRRHAKLIRQNGNMFVEDMGSQNGVRVNGDRIDGRTRLAAGDTIEIGDYFLEIEKASTTIERDTNPTEPSDGPPEASANKTPPLAVPAPMPRTQPLTPAAAPANTTAASARREGNATSVIRLTDLQRGGGAVEMRALAAHEQPRIVCIAGQLRGTEFKLRQSVTKFGRTDDGNEIVIDHQSISRSHGRFQLEDTGWKLYDNKSANGVRVNGDEYEMSPIRPGDTIELGHVKFRFIAPGEAFQLPGDAGAGAVAVERGTGGKSKAPIIVGALVVVAVLAGAAVFALKPSGKKAPKTAEHCTQGQTALAAKNWDGAISALGMAKALNAECSFDVAQLLEKAKKEKSYKEQLDEAGLLLDEGKYRQVIAALESVPDDSEYSTESQLKATEARHEGIRKYTTSAQAFIANGRLEEASQAVDDIAALDDGAAMLSVLRQQINAAKASRDRAAPVAAAPVAVKDAAAKNPAPTEAPREKTQDDRNRAAEEFTNEGIRLIKAQQIDKAVAMFNKAMAEKPTAPYLATACRSLGIAHARAGDTKKTIEAYKCYLKADPNTPEREKIQALIAQHEG